MVDVRLTERDLRVLKASTRHALICGVIAGPLFVATVLVEGATRANYDPLRHPVSTLELGGLGWIQVANLIVAGLLTLAFAVGVPHMLRSLHVSPWIPVLIGVWAIGLLGAGVFITDPVSGYPPGASTGDSDLHGVLHDVSSIPGFLSLLAAQFIFWALVCKARSSAVGDPFIRLRRRLRRHARVGQRGF